MKEPNKCILITEASSSQTTLFSYNSNLSINSFLDKPKFILKIKMHNYALARDARSYYNHFFEHDVVKNHFSNNICDSFDLHILATGGMRNIDANIQEQFYTDLQNILLQKEINLKSIKTISGEEEARYAWLSLKILKESDCHIVFDLGGETGQITSKSNYYSDNIGKSRAIKIIDQQHLDYCYNDLGRYDGEACRIHISNYLSNSFVNLLPLENNACNFFAVSNFYLYFNDVCNSYLPYINSLSNAQQITIDNICEHKNTKNSSLALRVEQYPQINDYICNFWDENWQEDKAYFAKDACFAGNYNYQMLKAIGLNDGDFVHVDQADWALGAAYDIISQN